MQLVEAYDSQLAEGVGGLGVGGTGGDVDVRDVHLPVNVPSEA